MPPDEDGSQDVLRFTGAADVRLLELWPDPVIVQVGGRIRFVNPAATAGLGYDSPEPLLGRLVSDLVHPDEREEALARMRMVERGEHAPPLDRRVLGQDGTVRVAQLRALPCEFRGERAVLTTARDVTAEHRAATTAQRAADDLRSLLERAPVNVTVHRDGRIIWANAAAAASLGYERPEDLTGEAESELLTPEMLEHRDGYVRRVLAGAVPPVQRIPLRRRDGTTALHEGRGIVVDFDGSPAMMVVARDVSEEERLNAQMVVSDRLATLGTLAAGVAHEINNPLTFVVGRLERAIRDLRSAAAGEADAPAATDLADSLADALRGTRRVARLAHDLQTYARPPAAQSTQVDLGQVVRFAAELAHNEIRHRARLVVDVSDAPPVQAQEGQLGQVLLNLLVNAARAMPEGAADDHEIRVSAHQVDRVVEIEVRDTGPGIPAGVLAHVFEPFHTGRPGEGLGLGLYICRNLVESMGGTVDLDSTEGEGTTARVRLPVAPPRADAPTTPPPEAAPAPPRRGRILVVDDDRDVAEFIGLVLEADHDVHVLTNGREALRRIEAGEQFDLLLCDLMMPGFSGMELYQRLCESAPLLAERVVFVTGGAFTGQAGEFLRSVERPRIQKPFMPDTLLDFVARQLAGA